MELFKVYFLLLALLCVSRIILKDVFRDIFRHEVFYFGYIGGAIVNARFLPDIIPMCQYVVCAAPSYLVNFMVSSFI